MIRAYRKNDGSGEGEGEEFKEPTYRTSLPSDMIDRSKFSIWAILKQCVDKELYRFTIPIVWNEPLSLLQRMAEAMRYSNQLDLCARAPTSAERMKFVAGFLIGCLSTNGGRLSKPFNPLLGETYELISIENAYRIVFEQVSHHPPISAFHAESIGPGRPNWIHYGSNYPNVKLNILHGCIEAIPEGFSSIELPEFGELYTWYGIRILAHNLVIGKFWFEYSGRCEICCLKSKLKCVLDFKPYSWFSGLVNRFEGYICDIDNENKKYILLYGKWDEFMYSVKADVMKSTQLASRIEKLISSPSEKNELSASRIELVWRSEDDKFVGRGHFDQQYNFSDFAFKLNELHPHLEKPTTVVLKNTENADNSTSIMSIGPIAPTDSRLRPDMRLYEEGKIEEASAEKHRLEEKQRDVARKVEAGEKEKHTPLWFEKQDASHILDSIIGSMKTRHNQNEYYIQFWKFKNTYWSRDFSKCPDIF